jgi:putative ABC transport system ATP-binding protein
LDTPDRGSVRIAGVDWQTIKGANRARFRRRKCGFVAQGLTLLPQATAAENVEVPLLLDGRERGERRSAVADALERVGLGAHAGKMPDQLSGGEQQRAAIARALIGRPAVVLADEPTGNLDSATGQAVMELLTEAAAAQVAAVVLVTHDPAVAKHARRTLTLHSGRLGAAGVAPGLRGA